MSMTVNTQTNRAKGDAAFAPTRWTLVAAAGRRSSPGSQQALATLCETYWYPLYAYVRRRGHSPEDAQDLTQEFFARLLEKNSLRAADRDRGKFRSFLLAALNHFLAKEWRRAHAQKRGGGQLPIALDFDSGEIRYQCEPAHNLTPEKIYERRWAMTVLDRAIARLRAEYAKSGKSAQFERLKDFLSGGSDTAPYASLAAALGLTEGAVKVAVHRLRRRCRELVRAEIAETVASPGAVEEELRHLFEALSET